MRFYVIFGVTFILLGLIIFYDPYSKYLGVYDGVVNIEYNYSDEDYEWIYDYTGDNLKVEEINNNKWSLSTIKDGICNITFYYLNEKTNDIKYKIYYEFEIKDKKIFWINGEAKGLLDYPNPY